MTAGPASAQAVRRQNRALVLGAVAAGPRRSRAQLADELGLSRATVSSLVEELVADRLVRELPPSTSGRGRPALPLALDPTGPAVLGVELTADRVTAVVVDLTGEVLGRRQSAMGRARTPAATLRRVVGAVEQVAAASGATVACATVAVPGLLDRSATVRRLPNLPAWQGRDLAAELGAVLGLPVRADNEANLAALADLRAGDAGRDFLHVSGEVGVGAALVTDGALFRGARGFAGELGHTVVDAAGPSCACGARGCLEQYAGRDAVLRAAGVADVAELTAAAEAGGRRALRALRALGDSGRVLGLAIADAVNLLDVPAVVLGGLYARLFPWLAGPVRAELDAHVLSRDLAPTVLARSSYGVDAAVVGAALSALDDILTGRVDVRGQR